MYIGIYLVSLCIFVGSDQGVEGGVARRRGTVGEIEARLG